MAGYIPPRPSVPRIPRPVSRRPVAKRMTIAIGILAADGVVIAADTQESYGSGFPKAPGYKIFSRVVEDQDRAISVTGAGSAGYLDALMQDLADAFIETPDPAEAAQRLRTVCAAFYREHVKPMDVPDDLRPRIVAGLHWKNGPSFLMTNLGSALHRRKRPVSVGIGEPQAALLLGRLLPEHKKDLPTDMAALLAAYTIYRIKNETEGIGLGTHVTVLAEGHGKHFARGTIKSLEEHFDQYQAIENAAFAYVIGRPLDNAEAAPKVLADWFAKARTSIQELRESTPSPKSSILKFSDEQPGPTEKGGYIRLFGEALVTGGATRSALQGSKRAKKRQPPSPE